MFLAVLLGVVLAKDEVITLKPKTSVSCEIKRLYFGVNLFIALFNCYDCYEYTIGEAKCKNSCLPCQKVTNKTAIFLAKTESCYFVQGLIFYLDI